MDEILGDKNLLKQFIILNQLRSIMTFPTKKISFKQKAGWAIELKVTTKSIYNYLSFAKATGVLQLNENYLNLKSNKRLFEGILPKYDSKPYILIDFNPQEPKCSIYFSYATYFLEKQKHMILLKFEELAGGKVAALNCYNRLIADIEKMTYNRGNTLMPPLLTQKALSELLGFKSSTSGFYYKNLFAQIGLIEIKKMQKKKIVYTKENRGQGSGIGSLLREAIGNIHYKSENNLKNPPDVAILRKLKKSD